jgi:hypothetical protein
MKPKHLLSFFFLTRDIQFSVYLTNFKQYETLCAFYLGRFLKLFVNLRMFQPRPEHVTLLNKIDFFFIFFSHTHTYRVSWYYQSYFYSPTDAQVNCLENNFKIYIKINPNSEQCNVHTPTRTH